jgi:hypothetical protein
VLGQLDWTEEAEDLWEQLYAQMAKDMPGGLLGGIVARNQPQTLRLALTYALMDNDPGRIDVPHIKAAAAVWQFARDSAAYIFGDSTGDPLAERIKEELKIVWPDGLDRDYIYRDLFKGNKDQREIEVALQTLQRMGQAKIVEEKTGKRGRPRQVVHLARKP